MKFRGSIRSYFIQLMIAVLVVTALIWSVSTYIVTNYRGISQHFVEDDVVFLEQLSDYSLQITRAHAATLRIIREGKGSAGARYDQAKIHLDNIGKVIESIETSGSGSVIDGEEEEGNAIDSRRLVPNLTVYLTRLVDAVENMTLKPEAVEPYLREAAAAYLTFQTEISQLIVEVGLEVEQEYHEELDLADALSFWLTAISALALTAVLMVAMFRANRLTRDLEVIRQVLLQLGDGKLDVAIPERFQQKELQQMSAALHFFKETRYRLSSTMQALEESKQELESRVNQRTEELTAEVNLHKQAQQRLKLAAEVMRSTSEAVVITNTCNRIVDVNEAYCSITGYSRDEVIGRNPSVARSGIHDDDFYREMWRCLKNDGHWMGEIWDRRKSGEVYPKWLAINVVVDDEGEVTHHVGVFTDISELKSKEEQLRRLAHYDPLTGLPNRVLCKERVEQQLIRARRSGNKLALLFIDLDRFKHINDSLGHAAGDELLVTIARRLEENLRQSDTVSRRQESSYTVARLGGDEFIVALSDLNDIKYIGEIVERLQRAIQLPLSLCNKQVTVDSSIGIAIYPEDGLDYDELTRRADTAMYRAKDSGRNQFVFFIEDMNRQAHDRLALEIELRDALAKDQLELHYQPKICTSTGKMTGMEALVRWQHPERGMVAPLDFIQVAEDIGLIVPMGAWVMQTAAEFCLQLNQGRSQPLQMAVNISPRQFLDKGLVGKVAETLKQTGLPANLLELEITESVVVEDIEDTILKIAEIRALGVKIALDDFGTGYSSLSYLRRLPIDTLKIDRSFIVPLDSVSAEREKPIVEAIIRMGQQLQMKVVAEGVETAKQQEILCNLGCDLLQGYYFSPPLSAAEMKEKLQHNTAGQPAEQVG
ncbi:EAL domain-containing protein [Marinobacterium jannaschii]|uniref:EAL domain-containing protein n=1 Tax=Marinobacterium jannaschii TaxID=64970 RepID=UPI0006864F66|nr:EAL domain-containing protein [Marinobacterium jannaschii]